MIIAPSCKPTAAKRWTTYSTHPCNGWHSHAKWFQSTISAKYIPGFKCCFSPHCAYKLCFPCHNSVFGVANDGVWWCILIRLAGQYMHKMLLASYTSPHVKQRADKGRGRFSFFVSGLVTQYQMLVGLKQKPIRRYRFLWKCLRKSCPGTYSRHSQWVEISWQNFRFWSS